MATTIVSSTMLSKMAAAAGVAYVETLTGFKWIARAARRRPGTRLVFGYEEALGYEVGDAVSDKDGLSAALVAAEIAARAKAEGARSSTCSTRLASRFGVHATSQWSLRLAGAERRPRWPRSSPVGVPSRRTVLGGLAVTEVDDLAVAAAELPADRRSGIPSRREARVSC